MNSGKHFFLIFTTCILSNLAFGQPGSGNFSLSKYEIITNGKPEFNISQGYIYRWADPPNICIHANTDNTYDIAYLDKTTNKINIAGVNINNTKSYEIALNAIGETKYLFGFTKIGSDFIVGYSKDNSYGDENNEYWIARIDKSGNKKYATRIFGETNTSELKSKGTPCFGGRIVYNPSNKLTAFYLGHSMKWEDGIRHQGGYVSFLDENGKQLMNNDDVVGNTWYCSHNFDQRLIFVGNDFYTLAHGDAYPRALTFKKWHFEEPEKLEFSPNKNFFEIEGKTGDNTTNTKLGGLVGLNDGSFIVNYTTSQGRNSFDLKYVHIDNEGNVLSSKWLTNYNADHKAILPKVAKWTEDQTLIAWCDNYNEKNVVNLVILDNKGNVIKEGKLGENVDLYPDFELTNLSGGDIIWANGIENGHGLQIYRLKVSDNNNYPGNNENNEETEKSAKWVKYNGNIPSNAVIGGFDTEGKRIYIGLVSYNGGKHPGKVVDGICSFGYGDYEQCVKDFEILTSDQDLQWEDWNGYTPSNMVEGGYENGQPLPICKANYNGSVIPGKVVNGKCNIAYDGKEVAVENNYSVLTK